MSEKQRLFFALWPDEPLRQALAQAVAGLVEVESIRARRVNPARYHMTVLFLGDIAPELAEAAHEAANRVRGESFELSIQQFGYFHVAKVLWAGVTETPPALTALWLQLRDAMKSAGVPHEHRALAPHLTCLRDVRRPVANCELGPLRWSVGEFTLVLSVPNTAEYRVLARWPLKTGG